MTVTAIKCDHLTKDYGHGKGVFDVSLTVASGEVYGYIGPNGAGKSTTMRHLMGFCQAQSGSVSIEGHDCWREVKVVHEKVGYLPGETAFPDDMSGLAYLKLIARMRKMPDFSRAEALLNRFDLDPDAGIKRMSKGMKQKLGIVAAFMHDPDILLLDEPTSGLDPLMQNRFIELVLEEKSRGKTILLSSHIFDEVEKTCDRVGMVRAGHLIQEITGEELRHSRRKTYYVTLAGTEDVARIRAAFPEVEVKEMTVAVSIVDDRINDFIACLAGCQVVALEEKKHSLEEYFMMYYGGEEA